MDLKTVNAEKGVCFNLHVSDSFLIVELNIFKHDHGSIGQMAIAIIFPIPWALYTEMMMGKRTIQILKNKD